LQTNAGLGGGFRANEHTTPPRIGIIWRWTALALVAMRGEAGPTPTWNIYLITAKYSADALYTISDTPMIFDTTST
jgi:hypothetical protein